MTDLEISELFSDIRGGLMHLPEAYYEYRANCIQATVKLEQELLKVQKKETITTELGTKIITYEKIPTDAKDREYAIRYYYSKSFLEKAPQDIVNYIFEKEPNKEVQALVEYIHTIRQETRKEVENEIKAALSALTW